MSLQDTIRLLLKNWKLLVAIPLMLAASIFLFTRGAPRVYVSDTTVYTGIASGYSITGDVQADFFTANTAFDNLITLINSRETKEEVIIRLLASHIMLTDVDPAILTWSSYQNLSDVLPQRLINRLAAPTFATTYNNIRNYYAEDTNNEIYRLINSEEEFYSFWALNRLVSSRIGTSDILRVEYETIDPAICRHTLELLIDVFINRNRNLREGQTESVIDYYEVEARRSYERLEELERQYLAINEENNIINYEEQSKNIAAHREDLHTDYAEVEMQYMAAQSALETIEQRLERRTDAILSSQELLNLRTRVAELTAQISELEIFGQAAPGTASAAQLQQLRVELERATQAIQQSVGDYYVQTHTIEGIPTQGLLDEWVRNVILVEEGAARLQVMERRKQEFLREYERMAPLGAALRRVEREIDLAEREYLTFLNSLNASRLNQQNIELTAQLRVVDQPFLPTRPQSSRRIILLLLGAVGGFITVAGILFGNEFLDESLKKPSVAAKKLGLPVAGIIPLLSQEDGSMTYGSKAVSQLARHLILKERKMNSKSPLVIGLISHLEGEGKTTAIKIVKKKIIDLGVSAVSFHPTLTREKNASDNSTQWYNPIEYVEQEGPPFLNGLDARIIFVEFPPIINEVFPIGLLQNLNLILVTVRANRKWSKSDANALNIVFELSDAPSEIFLTGVQDYYSEEFADNEGQSPFISFEDYFNRLKKRL